jgi:DNA-binding GntR family transcriptional regulator
LSAPANDPSNTLAALATQAANLRLERRSTAARVSEMLRDSITRGELPPGTPLREIALSEALGVSRNTVREALRLLDHEGLVDYHIHRGVAVRRLSKDDLRDLYLTREVVQLAALTFSSAAPPEALEAISRVVSEAEEAAAAGDWSTVATLDIVFHQKIVELIGSERVNAFFRRVVAELRLAFAAFEPSDHGRFVTWNRLLVDLLVAGRIDECRDELREYLATAERMLENALARRQVPFDGAA